MIGSLKRPRIGAACGVTLLGALASAALLASGSAAARASTRSPVTRAARSQGHAAARTEAHAARVLRATDTAKLHYVSAEGSELLEQGKATGTLPGSMRALVEIGATISGSFTFYLQGGTLKGHGVATPHGAGVYESFAGTVTITGGTGRFIHAHGHTGLYGTFDRNTYALTIQTTGTFSY
jgi:hypothetical protein